MRRGDEQHGQITRKDLERERIDISSCRPPLTVNFDATESCFRLLCNLPVVQEEVRRGNSEARANVRGSDYGLAQAITMLYSGLEVDKELTRPTLRNSESQGAGRGHARPVLGPSTYSRRLCTMIACIVDLCEGSGSRGCTVYSSSSYIYPGLAQSFAQTVGML